MNGRRYNIFGIRGYYFRKAYKFIRNLLKHCLSTNLFTLFFALSHHNSIVSIIFHPLFFWACPGSSSLPFLHLTPTSARSGCYGVPCPPSAIHRLLRRRPPHPSRNLFPAPPTLPCINPVLLPLKKGGGLKTKKGCPKTAFLF